MQISPAFPIEIPVIQLISFTEGAYHSWGPAQNSLTSPLSADALPVLDVRQHQNARNSSADHRLVRGITYADSTDPDPEAR